ncbi:MAG: hypothetical protein ACE141_12630 [Bryobacteraceae bacterium]
MRWRAAATFLAVGSALSAGAQDRRLTAEERIELIRGLSAEFATVKTALPRSKKALVLRSTGEFDKALWESAGREFGPAGRVGDAIQITKLSFEDDRLVFELNGGYRGGRKWYERIEVGTGTRTMPIGGGSQPVAQAGTSLALVFPGKVPPLKSAEVKAMLAPVLDFNKRSANEQYMETLPPHILQAVKDKKAVEGMDRDQVLLALGRPDNKVRETVDGAEVEDWIYGKPPGRIVFVTFEGDKVIRVKESYANLGGSVAPALPPPR